MTYQILTNCNDGWGERSYGIYNGFTPQELEPLVNSLPTNWKSRIVKL